MRCMETKASASTMRARPPTAAEPKYIRLLRRVALARRFTTGSSREQEFAPFAERILVNRHHGIPYGNIREATLVAATGTHLTRLHGNVAVGATQGLGSRLSLIPIVPFRRRHKRAGPLRIADVISLPGNKCAGPARQPPIHKCVGGLLPLALAIPRHTHNAMPRSVAFFRRRVDAGHAHAVEGTDTRRKHALHNDFAPSHKLHGPGHRVPETAKMTLPLKAGKYSEKLVDFSDCHVSNIGEVHQATTLRGEGKVEKADRRLVDNCNTPTMALVEEPAPGLGFIGYPRFNDSGVITERVCVVHVREVTYLASVIGTETAIGLNEKNPVGRVTGPETRVWP